MADAQGWTDPARRAARGGARRCLWSGQSRTRWQAAGGVNCRQSGIPAAAGGGRPAGRLHLRFYAVDIGRSPDGNWWVLRDRTQAPSGSGYALENRLALSRALPDVYRSLKVERLAPFFQAFQAELSALSRHDETRVCVLTPGSVNETNFEHAL